MSRSLISRLNLALLFLALGFAAEIASSQQLYEADTGSGKILQFTSAGGASTFASGLNDPAGLAFDAGGNLFVAASGSGRIVKITPAAAKSTFASGLDEPTGLAFDASGNLFVAASGIGRIVKITPGAVKSTFASGLSHPSCLAFDAFGNLFAGTSTGVAGGGRIVKFTPGGVKTTFASGLFSPSGLAFDPQGNLYVADKGAAHIYKFTPAKTKSTFASGSTFGLAFDTAGNLFISDGSGSILESAVGGAVSTFATGLNQSGSLAFPPFTSLHSFNGTDGESTLAGLIQATDGDLYGTEGYGGSNCAATAMCGTIFKITPSGAFTTFYNFCSQAACLDGKGPLGPLLQGTDGDFYGTTYQGGSQNAGTIFKISLTGTLTTIHSFCSQGGCADGGSPEAGLIQATNGNLYGVAPNGGVYGGGTIFAIAPDGQFTTLYSFCAQAQCADGMGPSGVIQATDGDLYGTTGLGGANSRGTIFKITLSGVLTTLYNFCPQAGCPDGSQPNGLIQGPNGHMYGTTYWGGTNFANCLFGCGTIFQITLDGAFSTLYSFCSLNGCPHGEQPQPVLIQANSNLYGITFSGGANGTGGGSVFTLTPSGTLNTLYSFCSEGECSDGAAPVGLTLGTDGSLFGTTEVDGANGNYGTVFRLSVGLNSFIKTLPTSGQIGTAIKILGTNLSGASSVTFNGVAATFTVNSSSEISTTVPTGATSGQIQVVIPGGTLDSNVPFTVRP